MGERTKVQADARSGDDTALDALLALEAQPANQAMYDAYAAGLRTVAQTLVDPEGGPPLQSVMTRWLLDAMALEAPSSEWVSWRAVRWDAAVDIMSDPHALARFLQQTADKLAGTPPRRLNLLSLFKAKVIWRARDMMRKHAARAARRGEMPAGQTPSIDPQSRCVAGLVINRIGHHVQDSPKVQIALESLLAGGSITDAASASGLSRQAIYRALARMRRWVEVGE
jgi:hypothetical protein